MAEIRLRTKEEILENMALGIMLGIAITITVIVFFCLFTAVSLWIDSDEMSARPMYYVY